MDAAELKEIWQSSVRELLQAESYHVSSKWNKTFETVAEFLNRNPEIIPVDYVRIQIQHMLNGNMLDKMYPNVLSGEGAYARYTQRPTEQSEEIKLMALYAAQAECFSRVCATAGEHYALHSPANDFTPLFLGYMLFNLKRPLSEALRADAQAELKNNPLARKLFPFGYLKELGV